MTCPAATDIGVLLGLGAQQLRGGGGDPLVDGLLHRVGFCGGAATQSPGGTHTRHFSAGTLWHFNQIIQIWYGVHDPHPGCLWKE